MTITIEGRPISKKNSPQFVRTPYRRGITRIPSKAYASFEQSALYQLMGKYKPQKGPLNVSYTFYMKGKLDADCDNLIAGINDILQKAGIIEDDKYIVEGSFKKVPDCSDWKTVVEILPL